MFVTCGIYVLSPHSAQLQIPVNVRQARRLAPGALQSAVGGWSRGGASTGHPPPQATHTEHPKKTQSNTRQPISVKISQFLSFIAVSDFHGFGFEIFAGVRSSFCLDSDSSG
jgi:hypothetical protein